MTKLNSGQGLATEIYFTVFLSHFDFWDNALQGHFYVPHGGLDKCF
jgi:hypothetical protein